MPGPTLAAQYFTKQATVQDAVALSITTTSNPIAGDILVVKLGTWGTADTMSAPSGGSQTFTSRKIVQPGGFNQWAAIYTCKVTGSPGNFTITSTPGSTSRHSMEVEHWTGADLAATPATNSTVTGTGAAQASLTTTGANSVISWTSGDAQSQDPAGRTALSNNTFENVRDDHVGANGVDYHGYMTTTTAGAYTFGMSAPTGQTFVIAGVEILAGSTTTPFTKDVVERYRVYNTFTKDVVERYRVTNAFTKDVVETYRVLNSFTKDVIERYRVFNGFTKDVVETYRVFNGFTKDIVEQYRVLNAWTRDVVETYRVLNGFTKDVVERYNVLSGTAFTKDVIERYRVLNAWTLDVVERYRVLNPWTRDVVERYNVITTTPFVKDIVERYTIFGVVLASDVTVYLGPVTTTVSLVVGEVIADLRPIGTVVHLD